MMWFPGSKESITLLIFISAIFSIILYSHIQFKKNEIRKYEKKYEMECELIRNENLQELRMSEK